MFDWLKRQLARAIMAALPKGRDRGWPPGGASGARMYHSAKASRLTNNTAPNSSADNELVSSLRVMRARSRQLIRDTSYGKRARTLVINNVVGQGIGVQAQVRTIDGRLNRRLNTAIEEAHKLWCVAENCHTGARLHFSMLERMVLGQVFEAGEVFVRLHMRAGPSSRVPLMLEIIEAERVPDEFVSPYLNAQDGNEIRMGVEVEAATKRPVAYWILVDHPSEHRFSRVRSYGTQWIERVPAEEIIHIALIDRWPQTRGEPWMHAVARRLEDMDAYSEAEIIRARVQALTPGAIETPEDPTSLGTQQADGSFEMELQPGVIRRLLPGEKMVAGSVTAPNPALDPFMRYMVREFAAGVSGGVSYESVSRDYSQSNYSSSRLALLDDRDVWKVLQTWFVTEFRERLYKVWMTRAVLARAIDALSVAPYAQEPERYQQAKFKTRGWGWVEPDKEVKAAKEAIKGGLKTLTSTLAEAGVDLEDLLEERRGELDLMAEYDLEFDTSPDQYMVPEPQAAPKQGLASEPETEDTTGAEQEEGKPARIVRPKTGTWR